MLCVNSTQKKKKNKMAIIDQKMENLARSSSGNLRTQLNQLIYVMSTCVNRFVTIQENCQRCVPLKININIKLFKNDALSARVHFDTLLTNSFIIFIHNQSVSLKFLRIHSIPRTKQLDRKGSLNFWTNKKSYIKLYNFLLGQIIKYKDG